MDQPFLAEPAIANQLQLRTPQLNPELWSPQTPNLYRFELFLKSGDKVIDNYNERFGFRTFVVEGNKFLLNGKPFWLRGANPFPNTIMPNDKELARHFIRYDDAGLGSGGVHDRRNDAIALLNEVSSMPGPSISKSSFS